MSTVGVVINEGKELGGGLEALRAVLAGLGHADPPWYEVPKSKHAPDKIAKLVDKHGVDRLLVWGGDGTVRRSIHTLLRRDLAHVVVGILPAGTGNLLAKNLGIPIDLDEAARIAVTGEPRPIDVGLVNGQHFAVMAGTGFDAMMIRDADENDLKERFGRLGYVIAGARNTGIDPARFEVTIDGQRCFFGEASGVVIANVGTILGGLEAFPDADPTDGRLDVGVIEARTNTEWVRLVGRAALGRADRSPLAHHFTASTIEIVLDRSLPWEVDGGDRERTDRYDVTCLPGAIRIAQPWASATDPGADRDETAEQGRTSKEQSS